MSPEDLERTHLAFLDEEVGRELLRHERAMKALEGRRRRAEHRLRLAEWQAQRPVD